MSRELLTAAEVAKELRVHIITVYKMNADGRLKPIRLDPNRPGGPVRYDRRDIDAFLDQHVAA